MPMKHDPDKRCMNCKYLLIHNPAELAALKLGTAKSFEVTCTSQTKPPKERLSYSIFYNDNYNHYGTACSHYKKL